LAGKVHIEVTPDGTEEIIIRCASIGPEELRLKAAIERELSPEGQSLALEIGDNEYIVPISELLFFESDGSRTAAHTRSRMYYTPLKLYELENILPGSFMRVSKSCVLNINAVNVLQKDLTGICRVGFRNSEKAVYVSRMYYKPFRERLFELRKVK